MAQRGSKQRKRAPVYSMDTIMLRYAGGLALVALGAVIFLAVDLKIQGYAFQGLRGICCGLCGGLAIVLPVIPLWAGIIVIWSTQRKAPVRPWAWASLAFIGVCTFVVLVTRTSGGQDYFTYLSSSNREGWGSMIHAAYENCARYQYSGGALGTVLAWPLWRYLGTFLGAAIAFLLTVACVLLAANLTPKRIRELASGQAGKNREQRQARQAEEEARRLAWQQQQEMERQQQLAILQQQQLARQTPQPDPMPQQPWQQPMQVSSQTERQRTPGSGNSVEAWQDQYTARQMPAAGEASRIFGTKQPSATETQEPPHRSRLFQRKEPNDGLSDGPAPSVWPPLTQADQVRQTPLRPVAASRQMDESGETDFRKPGRKTEPRPESRFAAEWNRAEEEQREERRNRRREPQEERREQNPQAQEDYREVQPQLQKQEDTARTEAARRTPETTERPEPDARRRTAVGREEPDSARTEAPVRKPTPSADEPEPVKVPKVQQRIRTDAYKPELVLPSREPGETDQEETWIPVPYNTPRITNLSQPKQTVENTAEEDAIRSLRLEETLASFRVQAHVVNVTHGPAISRFELELAAGTKVNKVSELEKDIAYGMEATSVRIEAPIPGKSLVGVEVPNRKVSTVTLREVLESDKMQNARSVLTVALGKDIAGTPIVCDLARMPHMLIAGQTGSGKSVCINAIINSLLYRAGPEEVRLILVDPKVVELQCYNNIPHLLIPVVNDPHKAAAALAWAVAEMMERYDKFAERKVRNLDGYNTVLGPGEKPMARIVIIIDELADLMMVCKKDVEEYICRLTQLARAAGIHLIVATQRPSVDVITGLIKANIPSRIAFKTASSVDSRTILDRNGSEQLLGWGDMLYLPTGSFAPTRVQGCFLSDEEVNAVVNDVRQNNPSTYDQDILDKLDELAGGSGSEVPGADMVGGSTDLGGGDSSLFEQAVELAIADGQISTSTLQRRLRIGYARAGRLTDEMEERGIVAAKDGSKPRKCLITREEWEELKKTSEGMV